jgi:alanine racemase
MDRIMIEIGDKDIKVGDEAVLIGSGRSGRISAWDWCRITGSIPYEVTCGISKRVERKYIDEVN